MKPYESSHCMACHTDDLSSCGKVSYHCMACHTDDLSSCGKVSYRKFFLHMLDIGRWHTGHLQWRRTDTWFVIYTVTRITTGFINHPVPDRCQKFYRKFCPILQQEMSWKFSAILKKDRCQVFRGNLHCPLQILKKYQYKKCRFSPSGFWT